MSQRPIGLELGDPPTPHFRQDLQGPKFIQKDKVTGDSQLPVEFLQVLAEEKSTESKGALGVGGLAIAIKNGFQTDLNLYPRTETL